jgi:hypothetical protein
MKTNIKYFFLLIFTSYIAYSQNTVNRKIEPFTRLYIGDRMVVSLVKSDHEAINIKTQEIDPENILSVVKNNTLRLTVVREIFGKGKIYVTLYYKTLKALDIQNGAEVSTESLFKSDSLAVVLKSGGTLYLDADVNYLNSYVIEGSLLSAEGYAITHDIVVATSATVSAFDLESEVVNIKASSGGKAKINVEKQLNAETASGGYIAYRGNPANKNLNSNRGGEIVVSEE